jgi:biotin transport system substrate-specific component
MSTLTLAYGRPTLADRVFSRRLVTDVILVAAGAGLTSLMAQIAIPLWPVPLTMQTFAVLFVGATLGPVRGALSMALYLVLGVVGLPVFSGAASGSLFALSSGGYIIGFIFAAAFVGWLAQREWDRKLLRTALAFLGGSAIMYAFGLPWLFVELGQLPAKVMTQYFGSTDVLQATLVHGLYVFLLGDILKAVLAGVLLPLAWRALGTTKRGKSTPDA